MHCREFRCAEARDEARSDQVVEVRQPGQCHGSVWCCVMVVIDVVDVVLVARSLSVWCVEVDRPLQIHEVCKDIVEDERVEVHVVPQVDEKICSADTGENCPVSGCCGSRSMCAVEKEIADRMLCGCEAFQ